MTTTQTIPRVGEAFLIPGGTPVWSLNLGDWMNSPRDQLVKPYLVMDDSQGYVLVRWYASAGQRRAVVMLDGEFVDRWPWS